MIVSGSDDGTIAVHSLRAGEYLHTIVFGMGRKGWNGPLVDTVGQGLGQRQGTGQVRSGSSSSGGGIYEGVDEGNGGLTRCRCPVHLLCLSPQEGVIVAYSCFTAQSHSGNDNNGNGGVDNSGSSGSSGSSASSIVNHDVTGALCSYTLNGRWLKSMVIVDERINTMVLSQVETTYPSQHYLP